MNLFLQKCADLLYLKRNRKISDQAFQYIKKQKKKLIKTFIENKVPVPKKEKALAFFMAGSPGAGKTEFSRRFIESLSSPKFESLGNTIIRIDADEIRESLPSQLYNGKNAHVVQKAAAKGAHILFDYVSSKHYNFLLDGTFANLPNSIKNIEKLIRKENFLIEIWYIYQDPVIAWDFTKKREALENRRIKKKDFIRGFFDSRKNVNTIKKMFPKNIRLNLSVKNCSNDGIERFELGVTNVDHYLKKEYSCDRLMKMLR